MKNNESIVEGRRFGDYLRRVREKRKLSLDAVAEMTAGYPERVTKSHLSRIENGQAVPTFPKMFALSEIYDVPVAVLAERFERSLKQGMATGVDLACREADDVRDEARRLKQAGRFGESLVRYDHLLDGAPADPARELDLRLERAYCLIKLERYTAAKDEYEDLLGRDSLSPQQRLGALECFIMCCYHLGKISIAMMALDQAQRELESLDDPGRMYACLEAVRGNVLLTAGAADDAFTAYRNSLRSFEEQGDSFEACRLRVNMSTALIAMNRLATARKLLHEVLPRAERSGYDRQQALALSNLALLSFRAGDLRATEAYCLRSNVIARPREYVSLVFRNLFYLWRVARANQDSASLRSNERALRALLGRVEEMPETEEFRKHLAGGGA